MKKPQELCKDRAYVDSIVSRLRYLKTKFGINLNFPGKRGLDVGCGFGYFAKHIQTPHTRVYCIDCDPEAVRQTKRNLGKSSQVYLLEAESLKSELFPKKFPWAFSHWVYDAIDDFWIQEKLRELTKSQRKDAEVLLKRKAKEKKQRMFQGVARVLKQKGKYFVIDSAQSLVDLDTTPLKLLVQDRDFFIYGKN